jgi:hypothetical protein
MGGIAIVDPVFVDSVAELRDSPANGHW